MKKATFILILLLSLPVAGFSQYKEQNNFPSIAESLRMPTTYNGGLLLGFLDMNKIQMQHSYSMGFSSGGYGGSNSYGMYTNSIFYPVNDKLQLNFNLGYIHNPFQSFQAPSPAMNQGSFVGSGEINFFPTENMHLRFSISNYPRYEYNRYQRYRRY
ncbi:MAG: hypothetical protein IIB94_00395 [Candidatus Marinimicrobia bacterium]|nr:hypothetical protein [Candidatus Neomarinimicrobiota bacterium]